MSVGQKLNVTLKLKAQNKLSFKMKSFEYAFPKEE